MSCSNMKQHAIFFSRITNIHIQDTDVREVFPELNLRHQTPDVLFKHEDTVYLGDVAVTNNYTSQLDYKRTKYYNLRFNLETAGYKVVDMYIILLRDCRNLSSLIDRFKDPETIVEQDDILELTEVCSLTERVVKLAKDRVNDHVYFESLTTDGEKNDNTPIFPSLEGTHLENKPSPIKKDDRKLTSQQLFQMAFDQMQETITNYYDGKDKVTVIAESFDEVWDKLEQMDDKEIGDFLIMGGNYHEVEEHDELSLVESFKRDLERSNSELGQGIAKVLTIDVEEAKKASINKKDKAVNNGKSRFEIAKLRKGDCSFIDHCIEKLKLGKRNKNTKKKPATLKKKDIPRSVELVEEVVNYLGSETTKPAPNLGRLLLTSRLERRNMEQEIEAVNKVANTNALQMCESLDFVAQRLFHTKSSICNKPRLIIPPNKSFIMVIPSGHKLTLSDNVEIPFFTVSRTTTTLPWNMEVVHTDAGRTYYISKLYRLNLEKIANWINSDARLVSAAVAMVTTNSTIQDLNRVIGICTCLTLDIHQKTSEILDLFKYIAWQPQSELTRLKDLLTDKFNMMHKTTLDVWLNDKVRRHLINLATAPKPKKPNVKVDKGKVLPDSFGVSDLLLPSFLSDEAVHVDPLSYVTETALVFSLRGKKLYGEQFMDKSFDSYIDREDSYIDESGRDGWCQDGYDKGKFPFDRRYAFSKDLIMEAITRYEPELLQSKNSVLQRLRQETSRKYLHEICSLRGCMKDNYDTPTDIHSTSMHEALKHYEELGKDEEKCKLTSCGIESTKAEYMWKFSMSAKEQRGGGRVICSPSILTKAGLRCIEGPEMALGAKMPDNVMVAGKNKITSVSNNYTECLEKTIKTGNKVIAQVTEDQSKWSEEDNTTKYLVLFKNRIVFDEEISRVQYEAMLKLRNRLHFNARPVDTVTKNGKHLIYKKMENCLNLTHGWPQGMLNHVSTTVHSYISRLSVDLWNENVPEHKRVVAYGEVNSDDSHLTLTARTWKVIEEFTIFRVWLKRMAAIRTNVKKTYVSSWCGEMVSNYCLNGRMVIPWVKLMINCFQNQQFISYHQDTLNIFSNLHQLVTNGAPIAVLAVAESLMKMKLDFAYSMKHFPYDRSLLPIQLGGYPSVSVFEMAINQESSHNLQLKKDYALPSNRDTVEYKSTVAAAFMGAASLAERERGDTKTTKDEILQLKLKREKVEKEVLAIDQELDQTHDWADQINKGDEKEEKSKEIERLTEAIRLLEDLEEWDINRLLQNVENLPREGDIYHYITTAFPIRKGVLKTVNAIKNLPNEDDGLAMIVTRPSSLDQSLGHLKARALNMVYELSESGYTRSKRKLYAQQALASTGRIWGIRGEKAKYTLPDLIAILGGMYGRHMDKVGSLLYLNVDSDTIFVNHMCTYAREVKTGKKPPSISNLQPVDTESRMTISNIRDVALLNISTNAYLKYSRPEASYYLVRHDLARLKEVYKDLYTFYSKEQVSNIIVKTNMQKRSKKYWIAKPASHQSTQTFYRHIYENTLSGSKDIKLSLDTYTPGRQTAKEGDFVQSLTTLKLASMLHNNRSIFPIMTEDLSHRLYHLDVSKLEPEDHKKYIWLMFQITGNREWLDTWKRENHYREQYIKRQKYVNGTYVGKIEVVCQEGKDILNIEGEPGDFVLTANTMDVTKIMRMMHSFTYKNFRQLKYNNFRQWGVTKMWGSKRVNDMCLNYYGQNSSVIERSSSNDLGIPFTYNKFMKGIEKDTMYPVLEYKTSSQNVAQIVYVTDRQRGRNPNSVKQMMSLEPDDNWKVLFTIQTYPLYSKLQGFQWIPEASMLNISMKTLDEHDLIPAALSSPEVAIPSSVATAVLLDINLPMENIASFIAIYNSLLIDRKLDLPKLYETNFSKEVIDIVTEDITWEEVEETISKGSYIASHSIEFEVTGSEDIIISDRVGSLYKRSEIVSQLKRSASYYLPDSTLIEILDKITFSRENKLFHKEYFKNLQVEDMHDKFSEWAYDVEYSALEDSQYKAVLMVECLLFKNRWSHLEKLQQIMSKRIKMWKKSGKMGTSAKASDLVFEVARTICFVEVLLAGLDIEEMNSFDY